MFTLLKNLSKLVHKIFDDIEEDHYANHHLSIEKKEFFDAISKNDKEKIIALLKIGVDVDTRCMNTQQTALMIAASKGNVAQVKIFLSHGCDPNLTDGSGRTALMLATLKSHMVSIYLLAKVTDIRISDTIGKTALIYAAEAGQRTTLELFLSKRTGLAIINHKDEKNENALSYALKNNNILAADALILAGAEIIDTSNGRLIFLKSVLSRKLALDCQNPLGQTALMVACSMGYPLVTQNLIKRGACVNIKDRQGITAIMHLSLSGNEDIAVSLINAKANLNSRDLNGWRAIHYAVLHNQLYFAKLLIQYNADLLCINLQNMTPLALARVLKLSEMTDLILDQYPPAYKPVVFNRYKKNSIPITQSHEYEISLNLETFSFS